MDGNSFNFGPYTLVHHKRACGPLDQSNLGVSAGQAYQVQNIAGGSGLIVEPFAWEAYAIRQVDSTQVTSQD